MELKEFSHKGEAIEKEIKKEFQFMGRTIKKRRVGLIIAAAGVIAVIAVALFIHSQQFDVWDYITISYEGANGYAKPVFTLNKDKLYKELMGKSTDSDKSYNVKMLIASIETSTDEGDHPRRRGSRREDGDPPRRPAAPDLRAAAHREGPRRSRADRANRRFARERADAVLGLARRGPAERRRSAGARVRRDGPYPFRPHP